MSLADFIILIAVLGIMTLIIYNMIKKKDESVCAKCAYAKKCDDQCITK